jgi:signal transduction histidine kinase
MRKEAFAFNRSWRYRFPLWAFLLPLLIASVGLGSIAILKPWAPGFTLMFLCLIGGFAAAGGALLSADLPRARALRLQAQQLQAVYEVLSKTGGSLDLQEVLDAITRLTVDVTGVRGCSIKLLDEVSGWDGKARQAGGASSGGGTMRVRSLAGIQREVSALSADAAENIYAKSLLDGQPVRVEGALERDFPELDGEVESLVCVPLRRETTVVGALCLYGEKGKQLPPETLPFLSRLGDLVGISIENASVLESLKGLDDAKTWFLLKASHELKSPLASIQSICQTMLEGYLGEIDPKQRELIGRIRFRASVLLETANDLLVLAKARAQSGGGAGEDVEPCGVLEETVRFYQPAANEKNIRLEISAPCDPCRITATGAGLRSVMSNLISNAIKYSPPGSGVSVTLERERGGVRFTVRDRGIGIPAAERGRLFREFFRASNARSMTESGTGLGLAIVKSVVDRLGGAIDVQSEEGKGTSVSVLLGKSR